MFYSEFQFRFNSALTLVKTVLAKLHGIRDFLTELKIRCICFFQFNKMSIHLRRNLIIHESTLRWQVQYFVG